MVEFVKPKSKKALLPHLKSAIDTAMLKWRRDAIDAFVSHEELEDWATGGGSDHGALSGLSDDDHALYLLASGATSRAAFAANWGDLTDTGDTTLHGHDVTGLTNWPTIDYSYVSGIDGATDVTAAEFEELSDGTTTTLHNHNVVPEHHVPTSVTTNTGTYTGGNVASVGTPLNGDTYDVDEVVGTPGFDIQFDFSGGIHRIDGIWLRTNYNGSAAHIVDLYLYNYDTTAYVLVGRIPGYSNEWWFTEIPFVNNANYISSGAASLKIYHTSAGNASHDISIDYVAITDWETGA